MSKNNCLEISIPFVEAAAEEHLPIQLLGGLGSAAIVEADTEYNLADLEIVASKKKLEIPRFRDNQSVRDLDVLVLTTDQAVVDKTEAVAADTIGDQLEVNVFGLHDFQELKEMQASPFSKVPAFSAVGDRYVVDAFTGSSDGEFYKAVFPFGLAVPQSALETWHVVSSDAPGDAPIPVPNPAMMVLNDLTRSIAGLRRKYDHKVANITDNLFEQAPELVEWMVDGPGQSHLILAGVLRSLGWLGLLRDVPPISLSNVSNWKIQPPKPDTLKEHPAFLMGNAPRELQLASLALARVKSTMIVGPVERHFQDLWEQFNGEHLFKDAVRNR